MTSTVADFFTVRTAALSVLAAFAGLAAGVAGVVVCAATGMAMPAASANSKTAKPVRDTAAPPATSAALVRGLKARLEFIGGLLRETSGVIVVQRAGDGSASYPRLRGDGTCVTQIVPRRVGRAPCGEKKRRSTASGSTAPVRLARTRIRQK